MVFDLSRRYSFDQLYQWENQLRDQDPLEECFTTLLANKDDLAGTVDDDEEFIRDFGLTGWKRVSAVDGRGCVGERND